MPVPPALFTQAQLEIALGGSDKLVQLAKAASINDPVIAAFMVEVTAAASGKIYSVTQIAADVNDPNILTPFMVQCGVVAGVYWSWHKSTGGQAIPPEVKEAYRDAIDEVKEYAEGLRAIGATPTPSTSAGLENIDPNPTGTRITRKSLGRAGFT
jgi:hypothetical protein